MRSDTMAYITDFDQVILNIPYCCSFVVDEMTHSVADFSSKVVDLRKTMKSGKIEHITFFNNISMIWKISNRNVFLPWPDLLASLHPPIRSVSSSFSTDMYIVLLRYSLIHLNKTKAGKRKNNAIPRDVQTPLIGAILLSQRVIVEALYIS